MFKTHGRRISAALTLLVATFGSLLALAGPASADPINAKGGIELTVTCADGHSYTVVSNGNGHFTPAHDINSTATLIPLWFGEQMFTVTDPNGVVVDQETAPAIRSSSSTRPSCAAMARPEATPVKTSISRSFSGPNLAASMRT